MVIADLLFNRFDRILTHLLLINHGNQQDHGLENILTTSEVIPYQNKKSYIWRFFKKW